MSLLDSWRNWRLRRKFKSVGVGTRFAGVNYEIKGRVYLGAGCTLRGNLVLRTHKGGEARISDGVEIGDYVIIQVNGRLEIGENTCISPYTVIRDTNHLFQGTDIHWRLTPHITDDIRIGKNCYIGAGTYIMPGVTIGDGAVIAPQSVINRDIGPLEVWAGAPATRAAHRTDSSLRTSQRRPLELIAMYGFGDSTAGGE